MKVLVPYWLLVTGAASRTGRRVRWSPSASNPEDTRKWNVTVAMKGVFNRSDVPPGGVCLHLGSDDAAVQDVILLLVQKTELQRPQSGCRDKDKEHMRHLRETNGI